MWREWSVADTVDAELINVGEVIACRDYDNQEFAGEVVKVEADDVTIITVESDLDGDRHELTFAWNDQIRTLVRDYSGVEV